MENMRTAEFLNDLGDFEKINPIDLKEGMVFKLFEADGTPVTVFDDGIFIAKSDAYYNDDGIVTLDAGLLKEPDFIYGKEEGEGL